ncbi:MULTISPECIES: hypothetical protein [unclassified Algibacter]|uniref:hypothetical protein n=1 Tax=unclassified Algibacter TaxID=2615009 RepID=UPI00131C7AE7|nr:hypothetical protein [Algibacter sp. L3A6]
MKKLSNFKDSKVELKNVNGGTTFSVQAINAYPGGDSTPGNHVSAFTSDINGVHSYTDLELNYTFKPRWVN